MKFWLHRLRHCIGWAPARSFVYFLPEEQKFVTCVVCATCHEILSQFLSEADTTGWPRKPFARGPFFPQPATTG